MEGLRWATRHVRMLASVWPAARMMGRRSGVTTRRFASWMSTEGVAAVGFVKRSARVGTLTVRPGVGEAAWSRERGAGSVTKPERAMYSRGAPDKASPTEPAVWRNVVLPAGNGVVMRRERNGELR